MGKGKNCASSSFSKVLAVGLAAALAAGTCAMTLGGCADSGKGGSAEAGPLAVDWSQWKELGWEPVGSAEGNMGPEAAAGIAVHADYFDGELFADSLNADKASAEGARHLALYRLDTLSDLEDFNAGRGLLSPNEESGVFADFDEAVSLCDKAFFEENALFVAFVVSPSGSYRFGVREVVVEDSSLCVYVEHTDGIGPNDAVTADMDGWLALVAVSDGTAAGCTEFDAILEEPGR